MENLSLSDDAVYSVLYPVKTNPVSISNTETTASYLSKCEQNILAEIWAMYSRKVNPSFKGWRNALMETLYTDRALSRGDTVGFFRDARKSTPVLESDVAWHLVLSGNQLFLLRPSESSLKAVSGQNISDSHVFDTNEVHVLGYVRPYIVDLKAVQELKKMTPPPLLPDLISPMKRSPYGAFESKPFSSSVPSNESQREIIGRLCHRIECIQGPPGTGKSTTIFHIVHNCLPARMRAIVTCVQNKAVDSIAEKLAPNIAELSFVVCGNVERLGECSRKFTAEAQAKRDPEVMKLAALLENEKAVLHRLRANMARLTSRGGTERWRALWLAYVTEKHRPLFVDIESYERRVQVLRHTMLGKMATIKARIESTARVIVSTMDALATIPASSMVIIDEAGTVPEYKLPRLVQLGAEVIVAIGDQNQLQPFTQTDVAGDGFFQRAVKGLGGAVPMLREQYRMHPSICDLVSVLFYNGKLKTAPHISALRTAVQDGGLHWMDYAEPSAESNDAKKRFNATEINMVREFMRCELPTLLDQGKTVYIITFYKHQYQLLMEAGERMGWVNEDRGATNRFTHPNLRIVTADSAQGSEADVVVLSCVRCNPKGELGFVSDRNRVCVALSRARERLLIVGSSATLAKKSAMWRAIRNAVKK